MINQILEKYLADQFGEFTPVRLTGGYTNQTYLLEGTEPPLVVKIARSNNRDIQNEVNCLKMIEQTGRVPKIYKYIETNELQLTVMEYRKGVNGQSILDDKDPARAKELYKSLGETLATSIHSTKYQFSSHGIVTCDLYELNFDSDFVPESLIYQSKEVLQKIDDSKEDWVLTHGDYGLHNVLATDDHGLTVLDWEWAEWANPLTDVSWVCWFTKLHYPEYAETLNELFLENYIAHHPIDLSDVKLKSYAVYKVWKVLNRLKQAPSNVQEEWVRRLKWTLDTEFLNDSGRGNRC